LIAADRLVGVMAIQSYKEENLYSQGDLALFSTIASQATVAIENAQLYTQMREQVWELSTPVLPVHDHVLVLPLIGVVDTERARRFTERLLLTVKQTRAQVVLLDITGVPMVDIAVAQALLQAAEATQLLGAEVALVGVRSEVAQTLVTSNVNMERLVTKANLQAGIEYALSRLGQQVTRRGI
jgi:rsbT co-antagonist protein RsbR